MPGIGIHIDMLLSATPNQYILLPHQHLYGKLPIFRHAELRQGEECGRVCPPRWIYHHHPHSAVCLKICMGSRSMNGFWTRNVKGILNDLQYTKQRISVISARYGFDSLSHFAHFCKDSFGDTPRALRKTFSKRRKDFHYLQRARQRPGGRVNLLLVRKLRILPDYGIISLIACFIAGFLLFLRNIYRSILIEQIFKLLNNLNSIIYVVK